MRIGYGRGDGESRDVKRLLGNGFDDEFGGTVDQGSDRQLGHEFADKKTLKIGNL